LKVRILDLKELEDSIRTDAANIARENGDWNAESVSRRLQQIADDLARMRRDHEGGIDASMGKRSGLKVEI
jgi:hypothetical protein